MAGLRSDEEILKAFEGLEYVPGSKKKRKEENPDAPQKKAKDLNDWDASPTVKTMNGKEVEFFTIGAFAKALNKSVVNVRLWERKGYIPRSPYRLRSKVLNGDKVGGNRVYTRPLIESAMEEFQKRNLLGTARVEWNRHNDLTIAIFSRWNEVTNQESN